MCIVQYIFLRSDLKGFSKGALIAQACHASIYAIISYKDDPATILYLADMKNMHKVILKIDEKEIEKLKKTLESSNINFVEWTEQPENIVTCLAMRPYDKNKIQEYFKTLKLF